MTSKVAINKATIFLPTRLTIEAAEHTAQELKEALDGNHKTLRIDAAAVEAITTPGIQLMIATMKALQGQNRQLAVDNQTQAMLQILQLMGMANLLPSSPTNGA